MIKFDLNSINIIIIIIITIIKIIIISNSNWTEWSTIQGVIARVILKYERDHSLNCSTRGLITN